MKSPSESLRRPPISAAARLRIYTAFLAAVCLAALATIPLLAGRAISSEVTTTATDLVVLWIVMCSAFLSGVAATWIWVLSRSAEKVQQRADRELTIEEVKQLAATFLTTGHPYSSAGSDRRPAL